MALSQHEPCAQQYIKRSTILLVLAIGALLVIGASAKEHKQSERNALEAILGFFQNIVVPKSPKQELTMSESDSKFVPKEPAEEGKESNEMSTEEWNGEISPNCFKKKERNLFPEWAFAEPYESFKAEKAKWEAELSEDIRYWLNTRAKTANVTACLRVNAYPRVKALIKAFEPALTEMGIEPKLRSRNSEKMGLETWECDVRCVWSMHHIFYNNVSWDMKMNHTILWEHPWFWRSDPIDPDRMWSFISWDYLNGLAMPENMPSDRWEYYFENNVDVKPWIGPRPDGYALILGQVPTDVAIIGAKQKYQTHLYGIYTMVVEEIQKALPWMTIVYRPHPALGEEGTSCRMPPLKGAAVRTHHNQTLDEAISGAAVAIAATSSALVEAAFAGIPTIAMHYVAPTYPISCHDFDNLEGIINGTACRPDRTQWLANVGYAMWNLDDVRNGNIFRYLFRIGGQQQFEFTENSLRIPP